MRKVILTILAVALPAFASWSAGGVKVVETPDEIENPQMVYINDGSVVISWEADRLIYCQKLDTTGVIHWDADGVRVCLSDSSQRDHHMVTDGQDVWFVWQDERSDDGDIYVQKLSGSTGQRLWGDQGKIVVKNTETQMTPRCALLEGGSLGVTCDDWALEPRGVSVQYLLPDGSLAWDSTGLPLSIGSGWMGGNGYVVGSGSDLYVCWFGWNSDRGIFCQKFSQAGDYLFDTTSTPDVYGTSLWNMADDANKGCIVLFQQNGRISAQRFDSLGNGLWGSNGLVLEKTTLSELPLSLLPQEQVKYGLLSDSSGGCFAAWGNEIYAQHVDFEGHIYWNYGGLNVWHTPTGYPRAQNYLSIAYDGSGGIFIAWDDFGIDSAGTYPTGVLVQRIDKNETVRFLSNGLSIWLESGVLPHPIIRSVPGACIIAWHDSRNSPNASLYAQIVDTTGKIGSGIVEKPPSREQFNLEVDVNIVSDLVLLKYSLPSNETGGLRVFDATGRLVLLLEITQSKGMVTWNVSNTPCGVYFVQLTTNNSRVSRKVVVIK